MSESRRAIPSRIKPSNLSSSKFPLVIVAKSAPVRNLPAARKSSLPSTALSAGIETPFETNMRRSCRADVSGRLPQTPAFVHPVFPAVSWHW